MEQEDLTKLRIEKSTAGARRVRRRRPLRWLVLLAVLGLGAWLAFSQLLPLRQSVRTATVTRLYPAQTFTRLNASGYVVAQRKASVAPKVTGQLLWLGVEEGSRVKEGQVIARLEGQDVAALRRQAEANLRNASASVETAKAELNDATLAYNRQKELLRQELVAKADYDAAEARYLKARAGVDAATAAVAASRAALANAEVSIEYTQIRAPFDGVVLTKNAYVGDIVTPVSAAANAKAAVVTMADMTSLEVEADVSESNLAKVAIDQPCEIQLDALPDDRFDGEVHTIVPTADRSKATVMVKVRFLKLDPRILPEMSAKVAFLDRPVAESERAPRTVVNPSAVVDRGGRSAVFLAKNGVAVLTPVTVGPPLGDMVQVESGVQAGDRVVVDPPASLKDGDKIRLVEQ